MKLLGGEVGLENIQPPPPQKKSEEILTHTCNSSIKVRNHFFKFLNFHVLDSKFANYFISQTVPSSLDLTRPDLN